LQDKRPTVALAAAFVAISTLSPPILIQMITIFATPHKAVRLHALFGRLIVIVSLQFVEFHADGRAIVDGAFIVYILN
jgi:hypothetical protein